MRRAALVPALAAALLACSGERRAPEAAAAAAPAAAPAQEAPVDPALEQFRPEDPEEVARAARREEARAAFRILREAYHRGGRASAASTRRLAAALGPLPAPPGKKWQIGCRGQACRVTVLAAAPEAWRQRLLAAPEVTRIADRLAADPDGAEAAVYLLLAEEDAAPGDDLVTALERELLSSAEAKACAASANARGELRYELRVDRSGFTYRADGDLPWPVVDCVNGVLGDIMRGIEVPPTARTATRVVALRL